MSDTPAVLFDLDDTLFDHRHSCRTALDAIQSEYDGLRRQSHEALEASYARLLDELHPLVLAGVLSLDDARQERFRRLFAEAGIEASSDLVQAVETTYRHAYRRARRPLPGALALLQALKLRAQIAIVTNNLAAEQREKLRCCGLDPYIDLLVVSEEAGVAKPAPAIFHLALERLSCTAERAVMLGDSWPVDVLGARGARIRAVWLNRRGGECPDPTVAQEIRSLEPLDAVLAVLVGTDCAFAAASS